MATEDEAARKSRAQRLREQIDQIKNPGTPGKGPGAGKKPAQTPSSPRDFIHEKMRELDQQKES